MHGVPKPERDRALADVAKLLQIDHLLTRKPGAIVGAASASASPMGARAGAQSGRVPCSDEPLSNLERESLRVDMPDRDP
jgi:carbohydrate ABC transporter ATP-binding protein, CUT1 family (TC 3.A.1.1.-)